MSALTARVSGYRFGSTPEHVPWPVAGIEVERDREIGSAKSDAKACLFRFAALEIECRKTRRQHTNPHLVLLRGWHLFFNDLQNLGAAMLSDHDPMVAR